MAKQPWLTDRASNLVCVPSYYNIEQDKNVPWHCRTGDCNCRSPVSRVLSIMSAFIVKDVRLFDGEQVFENASVLVEDGVIKQVGQDLTKDGVSTISKPGHTLLPGLIDAHCHPYREARLCEQAFRFGITTLMDMHNLHENAVLQKKWARERRDFPDVKSCHFAATIDGGWPAWVEKKLSNNEVGRSSIAIVDIQAEEPG